MSYRSVAVRIAMALAVSSTLVAAPLAARGYHGGYYGGPRGCYNCGNYNNGNVAGAVVGSLVALGFIAAIAAASKPQAVVQPPPAYAPVYPQQPSYQAPVQPDPAQTAAGAQAELCARAAERSAQNYGGFARTVSIESITGEQANATVRGTLEINPNNGQPLNRAAFTCTASYGQVTGVQLG